ncbi:MAG: ribonuclease H [Ignavibacteriae bacterium]|nr:ribonuclease H [Ignavibacteriota bacterium]NOG99596.1 ribonuclease H [Ignavibacteriota bacterium]
MKSLLLFTDGSVNTKVKTGYGAYLAVNDLSLSIDQIGSSVKLKRFENTSSTKLELQTLLWALNEIKSMENNIIVYTDSQNILGLQKRRTRLEGNDYRTKQNKLLKNHELYKEFFKLIDQLDCEFIKVDGHMPTRNKSDIDKLFSLVDKASRNALRNHNT